MVLEVKHLQEEQKEKTFNRSFCLFKAFRKSTCINDRGIFYLELVDTELALRAVLWVDLNPDVCSFRK